MFNYKSLSVLATVFATVIVSPSVALDLSLSNAVDMVVAASNDLKKADANVKKAEASLDAANSNRWFKLEGSASYMNLINVENPSESNKIDLPPALGGLISETLKDQSISIEMPDNIFQAGLSLTQPIYTFGKIRFAMICPS